MRLFFSLPLPDDVKEAVRPLLEQLRAPGLSVSRAEQLHFTLAFLGEQPEDAVERACKAVPQAAPFELALEGVGAFPDEKRARVIWLGVTDGARPLCALADALAAGLRAQGFALEERAFKPHLTLARVKGRPPRLPHAGRVAAFRATEIHLVHSVLGAGGAKHTPLRKFAL